MSKGPGVILLVDDDPEFLFALNAILTKKGYHVETASGGQSALSYLENLYKQNPNAKIDVIVSDLKMPDMEGDELLTQVRALSYTQATPFILMSGAIGHQELQKYISLDVDGLLFKPFSPDALLKELNEARVRRECKDIQKNIKI